MTYTVIDTSPTTDSTVLDTAPIGTGQNGGGEFREDKQPEKPESVADSIRSAIREADDKERAAAEAKGTEAVDKAKESAKEAETKARGEDGKFAKAKTDPVQEPVKVEAEKGAADKPTAERAEPDDKRTSEGRKYAEPPARFLPESKAKWANVPNEVKAEFHRVSQEYEQQAQQTKQTVERYETIRQFDEVARSNGRELKESLAKVTQIEQALARNPVMGLEMILREVGPRKADGSPVSFHELATQVARLSPQQYAQNMGGFQQQGQPQQQRVDPKVAQLEQTVAQLQGMMAQQAANPIIQNFAAAHPDYHSLEQQIATVLKSGIIEQIHGTGLSPEQRLEQAYRIAGGQGPSSHPDAAPQQANTQVPPKDRPVDPAGQKSITGALNSRGDDPDDTDDADADDIRSMLRKGIRKTV